MIIDFHTHIREGKGHLEDFIAALDANGIDMAVVAPIVPAWPSLGASSNEFVYKVRLRYPDRIINFASVVPTHPDAPAELEQAVREYGAKGLKLHPPIQSFRITDPGVFPVYRKAVELDIPILFHTGPIFGHSWRIRYGDPADIDDLAITFPELKIVMAHGDPLGPSPVVVAPLLYH